MNKTLVLIQQLPLGHDNNLKEKIYASWLTE